MLKRKNVHRTKKGKLTERNDRPINKHKMLKRVNSQGRANESRKIVLLTLENERGAPHHGYGRSTPTSARVEARIQIQMEAHTPYA